MKHERAVLRLMAFAQHQAHFVGLTIRAMRFAPCYPARREVAARALYSGMIAEYQMPLLAEAAAEMDSHDRQ